MIAIIIPLVWYFTDIVLLERFGVPTWESALVDLAYALITVLAITMCIKSVKTTRIIRVADKTVRFGFLERRLGIPLVDGGTQRLARIVGLGGALDLILTDQLISAEETYQWGLINYLIDEGKSIDKAVEIAELIRIITRNLQIQTAYTLGMRLTP